MFADVTIGRMARRHIARDRRPGFDKTLALAAVENETDADRVYDTLILMQPSYSNIGYTVQSVPGGQVAIARMRQQHLREMRNVGNLCGRQKFSGTQDHYTGLAAGKMEKIEILTLMMHSEDDPIVGYASVDWKSVKMNKYVVSATTKRGGHVQWHDGIFAFRKHMVPSSCHRLYRQRPRNSCDDQLYD